MLLITHVIVDRRAALLIKTTQLIYDEEGGRVVSDPNLLILYFA